MVGWLLNHLSLYGATATPHGRQFAVPEETPMAIYLYQELYVLRELSENKLRNLSVLLQTLSDHSKQRGGYHQRCTVGKQWDTWPLFDIQSEEMIEPNVSVWLFISTVYMPKIRFDLREHLHVLEYDLFALIYLVSRISPYRSNDINMQQN